MRSTFALLGLVWAGCTTPAVGAVSDDPGVVAVQMEPGGAALTGTPLHTERRAGSLSHAVPAGFGRDYSWGRIGHPTASPDAKWLAAHPRLGSASLPERLVVPAKIPAPVPPEAASTTWTRNETISTNVSPAIYALNVDTQDNTNDRLFAISADLSGGGPAGTVFYDIYTATPKPLCQVSMDTNTKDSNVALDLAGTTAYFVSAGKANGAKAAPAALFAITTGTCATWKATWSVTNNTVKFSSPWVDYDTGNIFVGDEQGNLVEAGSSGGGSAFALGHGAIHSTPVIYNGYLYVGTDSGRLMVYPVPSGNTIVEQGNFPLCAGSSCNGSEAIWGTPYVDTVNDRLLVGVDNKIWQIDSLSTCIPAGTCGAVGHPISSSAKSAGSGQFQSSVLVDQNTGTYIYGAVNDKFFRCSYTAAGGFNACAGADVKSTQGSGGATYPVSSPMQYPGSSSIYIGDGGGYLDSFSSGASLTLASTYRLSVTSGTASSIEATAVIDLLSTTNGHIYFGALTPGGGGYASINQNSF